MLGRYAWGRLLLAVVLSAFVAIVLRPLMAYAVDGRAHELIISMNYPHAMQLFERAQRMDPNLSDAVTMQLWLARLAPAADARAAIARSHAYLDRHPDSLALEYRAFAWQHLGDNAAAAMDFAQAAAAAPTDWKMNEMAAQSARKIGSHANARRYFLRVVQLKPGWPPAVRALRELE